MGGQGLVGDMDLPVEGYIWRIPGYGEGFNGIELE